MKLTIIVLQKNEAQKEKHVQEPCTVQNAGLMPGEGIDLQMITCPETELTACLYSLRQEEGYVTVLGEQDAVSEGYWETAQTYLQKWETEEGETGRMLLFQKRYLPKNIEVPFQQKTWSGIVTSEEVLFCHAFFLEGAFIPAELFGRLEQYMQYGEFAMTAFLLDIQEELAVKGALHYYREEFYTLAVPREGEKTFSPLVYRKEWYELLVYQFLLPLTQARSSLSLLWQYHIAFLVDFCVEANLNNTSKRLFTEAEATALLRNFGTVLEKVSAEVLFDRAHFPINGKNAYLRRWVYFILKKHNPEFEFEFVKENGDLLYGAEGCIGGSFAEATADIQKMVYEDGRLTIDGRISPMAWMNGQDCYLSVDGVQVPIEKKERYALTKTFGVSIFKLQSFHVEVRLQSAQSHELAFISDGAFGRYALTLEYDSHFSRLTNRFANSYWKMDKHTMMVSSTDHLFVKPVNVWKWLGKELRLWGNMLATKDKMVIKYIPVRFFMICKPLLKRKPLWLFMDKIYKGGDSSEYLYHYVTEHAPEIEACYVLDQNSADYKRIKENKGHVVVRRSLAHRRAFLYADWMIISNSTLFAFNDFSMKNSAYIRDLISFRVACVQHGMSVQKIAVAQHRLRDDISLYFCASKYELENLLRPVYDYEGYDILKLTGVPRYDGLVNRDQKQILISPTWRMQAAVPVTKNESVARDYNPLFKETSYYKVYNALINDERLLSAAKKYGYRIVYVLHPIVSPQVDDFTKNEYVDILPSTGDMSYEKVFCESSLMVTDYSGVQFDFAYMRKPLIYLHHREIPQHYEEGTFHYDTMAFGEICYDNEELITLLCEYMAQGCVMKEEYRRRADDFFAYSDHKNCERIYEVMRNYK